MELIPSYLTSVIWMMVLFPAAVLGVILLAYVLSRWDRVEE